MLDVISRALHDISQTTRLNHSVRRNIARSFSCDFDQTNGRVAQYLQLKISTEAALEKMTKGNKITEESAKNRMVISRQPSAKLTWQASYVASKMDNDSEADDDDPVQEDKPYCCVLS